MDHDRLPKRPGYLWYPGDARRDTALVSLPLIVRGLWREMLDLMHDGDPYGYLTAGGHAMTPDDVARIVGEPVREVTKWMDLLEIRRVLSRTESGVIYSRRMVRDEAVRRARADGGKGAPQPNAKGSPKGSQKGSPETPLTPPPAFALALAEYVPPNPPTGDNRPLPSDRSKPLTVDEVFGHDEESPDALGARIRALNTLWTRVYAEERRGATFKPHPQRDYAVFRELADAYLDDAHLEAMMRFFFRADDVPAWAATRSPRCFLKLAPETDAAVRGQR